MELGKTKNWFYALLGLAVAFIFVLGAWWLYLVFKLSKALQGADPEILPGNLALMVKWEGMTFFALTLMVGAALFYVFWQDHKKTKSLQTFYATLTHELKTPLASMRLQAQVLGELLNSLKIESEEKQKIARYGIRLQEDVLRLENELDKHLQLSRVERGGNLSLSPIALIPLIKSESKKYPAMETNIDTSLSEPTVVADQTALGIIFKNLFENTFRHNSQEEKKVNIQIYEQGPELIALYDDQGGKFEGDIKSLGKLFFKHDSPKGSGIGLYLAKRLAKQQGGRLTIKNASSLCFELRLKKGEHFE